MHGTVSDKEAWSAVAALYLSSLYMFFIAPVWIGLGLLVIAVLLTFVVIGQNRNRRHQEVLEALERS